MKAPHHKIIALLIALTLSFASGSFGQIITNFGVNAGASGFTWTWDSETSTLSGNANLADILFGGPASMAYTGAIEFSLTATANTAPFGSFEFKLRDSSFRVASAIFSWSSFTGVGATVISPIIFQPGFDITNVTGWNLTSGDSGQAVNIVLTNATAVIPEPTTMALLAGSLTAIMVLRRRRIS